MTCGIMQTWANFAAAFPGTLSMHHTMACSMPPTKCLCSDLQITVNAPQPQCSSALISMLSPVRSPRASGTPSDQRNHCHKPYKPLSPFSAVLAPVPLTPHSGSEAPRGPHPGTGHRNRTIFSPGQAEALEKGAIAGADSGAEAAQYDIWRQWP